MHNTAVKPFFSQGAQDKLDELKEIKDSMMNSPRGSSGGGSRDALNPSGLTSKGQ